MVEPEYSTTPQFLAQPQATSYGIVLSSYEVNITPTALTTPVEAAVLITAAGTEMVTLSNLVSSADEVTAAFSSAAVDPATPSTLTITLAPTELLEKTFTVTFDCDCDPSVDMPPTTVTLLQHLASYTLYASVDTGGSISPLGQIEVPPGATQVFTVTPGAGFVLDELLVDDEVAVLTGSTYTFANVTETHTISATFVEE